MLIDTASPHWLVLGSANDSWQVLNALPDDAVRLVAEPRPEPWPTDERLNASRDELDLVRLVNATNDATRSVHPMSSARTLYADGARAAEGRIGGPLGTAVAAVLAGAAYALDVASKHVAWGESRAMIALAVAAENHAVADERPALRRRLGGLDQPEPDGSEDAWPDTPGAVVEAAHGLLCNVDGGGQGWRQDDEWVEAADRWMARYDRVQRAVVPHRFDPVYGPVPSSVVDTGVCPLCAPARRSPDCEGVHGVTALRLEVGRLRAVVGWSQVSDRVDIERKARALGKAYGRASRTIGELRGQLARTRPDRDMLQRAVRDLDDMRRQRDAARDEQEAKAGTILAAWRQVCGLVDSEGFLSPASIVDRVAMLAKQAEGPRTYQCREDTHAVVPCPQCEPVDDPAVPPVPVEAASWIVQALMDPAALNGGVTNRSAAAIFEMVRRYDATGIGWAGERSASASTESVETSEQRVNREVRESAPADAESVTPVDGLDLLFAWALHPEAAPQPDATDWAGAVSDALHADARRRDGAALIAAERARQVTGEGWTADHDAEHRDGQLVRAATCYLVAHRVLDHRGIPFRWPWAPEAWKPSPDDRARQLVKAGALIAAEIDRLTGTAPAAPPPYRCPTPCDDEDCDALCHEGHDVMDRWAHDVSLCEQKVLDARAAAPVAKDGDADELLLVRDDERYAGQVTVGHSALTLAGALRIAVADADGVTHPDLPSGAARMLRAVLDQIDEVDRSAPPSPAEPEDGTAFFAAALAEHGRCECQTGATFCASTCQLCEVLPDGWPCPTYNHDGYPKPERRPDPSTESAVPVPVEQPDELTAAVRELLHLAGHGDMPDLGPVLDRLRAAVADEQFDPHPPDERYVRCQVNIAGHRCRDMVDRQERHVVDVRQVERLSADGRGSVVLEEPRVLAVLHEKCGTARSTEPVEARSKQ